MKKNIIAVTLMLLLCIPGYAKDYYSGQNKVKANTFYYSVDISMHDDRDEIWYFYLENSLNKLFKDFPYNKVTNDYCCVDVDWPLVYVRDVNEIKKLVKSTLFKGENLSDFGLAGILVEFAHDPTNGLVKEVRFEIRPCGNKKILSIPPARFEELEKKLIGKDFGVYIREEYKSITYTISGRYYFLATDELK